MEAKKLETVSYYNKGETTTNQIYRKVHTNEHACAYQPVKAQQNHPITLFFFLIGKYNV